MITLDDIRQPITAQLAEFETFVLRQIVAEGEFLTEMLRHALSARGKGIRPMLVLLSAAMHAGDADRVGRRSHVAALLVEMIHVSSLIHDDVVDEADMRRGRPSANALWQSHNAVILGDYILGRTIETGLASGQFDLVSHITRAITSLCEGEVLQSDCARRQIVDRESYYRIIRRKTASLLGVSVSAGALSVGAPREKVAMMTRLGEALGMAFQIRDDMLDYTRSAATGKPANTDLREGKITLPLLFVLERSTEERRSELLERLAACHADPESVEYLQHTVESCGGLDEAERVMQDFVDEALQYLKGYPASPYRDALENLCRYVARRDR